MTERGYSEVDVDRFVDKSTKMIFLLCKSKNREH